MDRKGRKNPAGGWLLQKAARRLMSATLGAVGLIGFSLGFAVRDMPMVDRLASGFPDWLVSAAVVIVVVSVAATFWWFGRSDSGWSRGLAGERRVGDRIEHALVRDGCAFAHDVKEALGPGGNVDHVVLTPAGVWVVETKAAWLVERRRFKEALRQAAGNVRRVRENLATPLPIRAALVIAEDGKAYEKDFDWRGEPIKAFRLKSFWRTLREECDGDAAAPQGELEELARKVWGLGSTRHLEA